MENLSQNKDTITKEITKASTRVSAMMLMFVLLAFVLGGLGDILSSKISAPVTENGSSALLILIVYSVQYLIIVPICAAVGNHGSDFRLRSLYRKPECSGGFAFRWIIIGFALMQTVNLLVNAIFQLIQYKTGKEFFAPQIGTFNSRAEIIVSFFVMVVYAPIFEELICRGVIYKNFHNFGPLFTIAVSGVAFGLMHRNYAQIFYACAGGMVMCYLCIKTKSIIVPMLMHFFINTLGAFGMVVYNNAGISSELSYSDIYDKLAGAGILNMLVLLGYIILIYGVILTGIILFIVELCCHKESFRLENKCNELKKGQKAAAFFRSPMTVITIILYIVVIIINASGKMYI